MIHKLLLANSYCDYFSQNPPVPVPKYKLVNFERVSNVKAGETRTVKIMIVPSQMTVSEILNLVSVILCCDYSYFQPLHTCLLYNRMREWSGLCMHSGIDNQTLTRKKNWMS